MCLARHHVIVSFPNENCNDCLYVGTTLSACWLCIRCCYLHSYKILNSRFEMLFLLAGMCWWNVYIPPNWMNCEDYKFQIKDIMSNSVDWQSVFTHHPVYQLSRPSTCLYITSNTGSFLICDKNNLYIRRRKKLDLLVKVRETFSLEYGRFDHSNIKFSK